MHAEQTLFVQVLQPATLQGMQTRADVSTGGDWLPLDESLAVELPPVVELPAVELPPMSMMPDDESPLPELPDVESPLLEEEAPPSVLLAPRK